MGITTDIEDALADIRTEFGDAVTFIRGATSTTLDPVSKGEWNFRYSDENGVTQFVRTVDWLASRTQLAVEPRKGDRISETRGGATYVYEATSINGEPCWRWSDPAMTQVRIHTLLIES